MIQPAQRSVWHVRPRRSRCRVPDGTGRQDPVRMDRGCSDQFRTRRRAAECPGYGPRPWNVQPYVHQPGPLHDAALGAWRKLCRNRIVSGSAPRVRRMFCAGACGLGGGFSSMHGGPVPIPIGQYYLKHMVFNMKYYVRYNISLRNVSVLMYAGMTRWVMASARGASMRAH